jgi:hypothetical protein
VRTVVGYHRYDTTAELLLLNKIWKLQSMLTNYFYPQQKLVSKVRIGAKVSKKYDTASTPYRRAAAHKAIIDEDKAILADTYTSINPAAVQRQIQASPPSCSPSPPAKADPKPKPRSVLPLRAHPRMSQRIRPRAHRDMRQQVDRGL